MIYMQLTSPARTKDLAVYQTITKSPVLPTPIIHEVVIDMNNQNDLDYLDCFDDYNYLREPDTLDLQEMYDFTEVLMPTNEIDLLFHN